MSDLTEEKNRLWNEVLGKRRAYEKEDAALKNPQNAMDELNAILKKQQKDLAAIDEKQLDELQMNLEKDYGVHEKPEVQAAFDHAEKSVNEKIHGEKEAVHALCNAFRRPYVAGVEKGHPANVIVVSGPQGSGRHASIRLLTESLAKEKLLDDGDVITIDLSRYSSSSTEQVFLQDLYEALASKAPVLCFENAGSCFPSFRRMISELAVQGEMKLNRRYVENKGMLVENQSGLVKKAVDSFKADGKILIMISDAGGKDIQNAFGAEFMRSVMDRVSFVRPDDAALQEIISEKWKELQAKCRDQLDLKLDEGENVQKWILSRINRQKGAEGVQELIDECWNSLSEAVLQLNVKMPRSVNTEVEEDVPYALVEKRKIQLAGKNRGQAEIDAVNKELDAIIGLDDVKKYIRSLQAYVEVGEKRREKGMKSEPVSAHMIFTGSPGTGKTTIARLLALWMKAVGILSSGQLVEVSRSDLVAGYVGQTAPLVMSVVKSAMGGVLFIDEAYSLYRGKDDSFGLEAIDTLVKAMEDNRENLVVILAGYEKEMNAFLEANSGLRSRFARTICFPDYSGEELLQIAILQAEGKGYVIAEDAKAPLQNYFTEVQKERAATAGNGRLARNVVEAAVLHQAERLTKNRDADLTLLEKEDFEVLK